MLSPKTKLFLLTTALVVAFTVLLYLLDVHVRSGHYAFALFVSMIAIIIYALSAKMKGGARAFPS